MNQYWQDKKAQYQAAYEASQIDLKAWCLANNINYNSARRHIKASDIRLLSKMREMDQNCASSEPAQLTNPSNQNALTHGGYANFIDHCDLDNAKLVHSLHDELLLCRARLMSVVRASSCLAGGEAELSDVQTLSERTKGQSQFLDIELKIIARIESLVSKISRLELESLIMEKEKVQIDLLKAALEDKKTNGAPIVTFNIDWDGDPETALG